MISLRKKKINETYLSKNKIFEINKSPTEISKFQENIIQTKKIQKSEHFANESSESLEISNSNSHLSWNSKSFTGTETPKQVDTDWNFHFKKNGRFSFMEPQRLWRNHPFKTLIFNPEASDATFDMHFNLMQKSLQDVSAEMRMPMKMTIEKNSVKLGSRSIFFTEFDYHKWVL